MKDADLIVGICDDEEYAHDIAAQKLNLCAEKMGITIKVIHFYSAKELLASRIRMDCILLDIGMPEMDGIAAGRKLNIKGISYKIIIITSKKERFKEGFEINAFRFVTKPIDDMELYKAVEAVYGCKLGLEEVRVYKDGVVYSIKQSDIIFIMANKSSTLIFTTDSEYRSEYSLTQWEKELEEKLFFKCHKSYLINLGAIADIENTYINLITGDKVEVSRRKRKELQIKYIDYDTRYR